MTFFATLRRSASLLAAVPLFGLATGALFPLIALQLDAVGASAGSIGAVTSFYYVGSLLGALTFGVFVRWIGYRGGFAIAALLAGLAAYGLTLSDDLTIWLLLRLVGGYALGAYYIVVDSWFQALADRQSRGKLFAVYETVRLTATALGPFLLVLGAIEQSLVMVAVAYGVSILPAWLNAPPSGAPLKRRHFSGFVELARCFPLPLIVAFCGGLANASFYGLSAVYAARVGLDHAAIAFFVAFVLVAPALSEIPLGAAADRATRMRVAAWCGLAALASCTILAAVAAPPLWLICIGGAAVGGSMVPMYAFGVSRMVDALGEADAIQATTVGLLAYNVGAFCGPVLGGLTMELLGAPGLYLFLGGFAMLASIAAAGDRFLSFCCPEQTVTN